LDFDISGQKTSKELGNWSMKILIIYDSLYGNTEKIAKIIGNTIGQQGEVEVLRVGDVKPFQLSGIKSLVVGSPTQQFRPTAAMKGFLSSIPKNGLKGVKVAVFDTRLTLTEIEKTPPLAFFERIFGYAAQRIAKTLKAKGGELMLPGEGFLVEGTKGPLVEGEEARARNWARKLFA
jgi:flavodoxin